MEKGREQQVKKGSDESRTKANDAMWLGVFEKGIGFRSSLRDFGKY